MHGLTPSRQSPLRWALDFQKSRVTSRQDHSKDGNPSRGAGQFCVIYFSRADDRIFFGHKLRSFNISDHLVIAHFENGVSVEGSLLVAAHGAGSVVRRQLLPNHYLLDTSIHCSYGKTLFSKQLEQDFPPTNDHGGFLILDSSSETGGNLAVFGETIKFQDNALRPELPDDYFYWLLGGDQKFFVEPDTEFLRLRGPDAVTLSAEITQRRHASIKSLLALQIPAQAAALRVSVASPDIQPWTASSKITFIGDSIHIMPPTGGIGANTALQDSAALAAIVKQDGISTSPIANYEGEMRVRAAEAIGQSLLGGRHMLGLGNWTEFTKLDL